MAAFYFMPKQKIDHRLMESKKVNEACIQAYASARDGKTLSLYAVLHILKEKDRQTVLNHKTQENSQVTTPFLIAARNGHNRTVVMLLEHFKLDIEQTGTVKFDGFVIESATALWCAAGAGKSDVVKTLIKHKANVNHPTLTNSTPLRAACFDGHLEIVQVLVQNGADLEIPNRYDNTCLMIACYKGHMNVVRYLLQKGADPNVKAHCGATALHFAVERSRVRIVKELIHYKAEMLANDQNMTPLQNACNCGQPEIVEYFISLATCSKKLRIESLELLGASYANDKDNYDVEKCYKYLMRAMKERYEDPKNPITKELLPAIKAYEMRTECTTVEELEAIKEDHNALHMESLIVRERILTEDNVEVPHPIIFRGAVFADTAQFDQCTLLWMRALKLRQKNNRTIHKDLLRFAQVFSQMLYVGIAIDFSLAKYIFEACLQELSQGEERVKRGSGVLTDDSALYTAVDTLEVNIHTALYLIVILSKINKSEAEQYELCRLVYQFNKMKLVLYTKKRLSPLHISCDQDTHVDDFHVNDVVKFPNGTLVKLLLQCGAQPDSLDVNGNTPLHVIVRYNRPISDFLTLHNIIALLVSHGAHLDRVNNNRETAFDVSTTGVAEIIMKTRRRLSLKCLTAQLIKKHSIQYKDQLPKTLEEFVDIH